MSATLAELASRFDCELVGDGGITVDSVGTLAGAVPTAISFLANPLYRAQLKQTRAAAVIVEPRFRDDCPTAALLSANPYAAYARIAAYLKPPRVSPPGVHPTAVVAGAQISDTASVGPHAIVEPGARIGDGAVVGGGAFVGAEAEIGAATRLHPRAVVMNGCRLGARCVIYPGAVIGSDGFGYAREPSGWVPVPQLGSVVLGDDVHVGANTTVDRGTIDDTVVASGVKLDNLVQIAHNVRIGEHTAMAALVGVAGSAQIGARCLIGGAVVIVGHVSVCDDVMVTFHSSVLRSITEPGTYSSGLDVDKAARWRRNAARFRRLDEQLRRRGPTAPD
jgi:UDP-3-O-[3-hydroxymyristoyl] glucosamine N-acyltransferase